VYNGSRLPRNIIEIDPDWLAVPADAPDKMAWINKRMELTAYCNVKDDHCVVLPHLRSQPALPDLANYRTFLNTSQKQSAEITKYLSSIYLNPSHRNPRFFRRINQVDLNQVDQFNMF
jgi:hypothetical protein